MIFNTFNPNKDVVAGRTTRVASGFWPGGVPNLSQSAMVDDFFSLIGSDGNTSYGTSVYDVRKTMYYLNMYPEDAYLSNNDPYFSVAYGHIAGELGSGSFTTDVEEIQAFASKTIYTQYKNLLLGTSDLDGMFTMQSGSTTVNAEDIWVISFSAYKMKDRIDEGLFEISFSGSKGVVTLIDNSPYSSQTQAVYQLITGSLDNLPDSPAYAGLGLLYPNDGIVVLNAKLLAEAVGIPETGQGLGWEEGGPGTGGTWLYTPGTELNPLYDFTYNHKTLATSIALCENTMKVRKSEYVPARHYFVRIMNRDFNYSNNPTYVWDGTDGIEGHSKGTIRNTDFVNDPKTYITTVGLYNDTNELVAVAKLSRPIVKSFDQEALIKVRLDF
jgi:hypothetical protein